MYNIDELINVLKGEKEDRIQELQRNGFSSSEAEERAGKMPVLIRIAGSNERLGSVDKREFSDNWGHRFTGILLSVE